MTAEIHTAPRQRFQPFMIGVVLVGAALGTSFRFTAVAVLFVLALLLLLFPRHPGRRSIQVTLALYFFVVFLPVDLNPLGLHGTRRGVSPGGVHLVRLAVGMPNHTWLIKNYGEYISGGCMVSGSEPKWILVWN